jgi:hypothetical protein
LRSAWRSQPPLRPDFAPEVIVQVLADSQLAAGVSVWALPLEGQGGGVIGVRADDEGQAWFRLPEPGRYRMVAQVDGHFYSAEVVPAVPGEWSQVKRVRLKTTW